MLAESYPIWLAGRPERPNLDLPVYDKYSGAVATRVPLAGPAELDRAIQAAQEAAPAVAQLPGYERQRILNFCVTQFQARQEEFARALCVEAGKPIRDAQGEVIRLIDSFRIAAEESVRLGGEVLPLDITPRAQNYTGMWKRVPVGPCGFITPFNFPLNLVAHKIAPALAAGCPFVLKPASHTPVGAALIGEVLSQAGLPPGAFSILPTTRETARLLVEDDRLALLSFTGSPEVGWDLKKRAGHKKVTLELGGNAACVVDEGSDLDDVVNRLIFGAFYQSGQSCISVQRILAHTSLAEPLTEKLVAATQQLKLGDPQDPQTFIGPLITEGDAIRLEKWIEEAKEAGARLLTGGQRHGAFLEPTLLTQVPPHLPLVAQEAFGPVAVISTFENFSEALAEVNQSAYGLHAGVFTNNLQRALLAWDTLEVGGVIINDVPSWRVDHMPYGGVKNSGTGREGIRFAMEEMTEIRLMVIRRTRQPGDQ